MAKKDKKNGKSKRTPPAPGTLRHDFRPMAGHEFEKAMAEPMAAYCLAEDIDYRIVSGTDEDIFGGTDCRVYGNLGAITSNAGILRMDFTSSFSGKTREDGSFGGKDNMPVLWSPSSRIEIAGRPVKFGIRTGNSSRGFPWPVVVIGLDMPLKGADMSAVRKGMAENAGKILREAGEALSAYTYMTEPAYAAWLGQAVEEKLDGIRVPDVSRLTPNYGGLAGLRTRMKSPETIRGMRLAMELASEDIAENPVGTHAYEQAAPFWRAIHGSLQAPMPYSGKTSASAWQKQFARALEQVRSADEADYGPDGPGY